MSERLYMSRTRHPALPVASTHSAVGSHETVRLTLALYRARIPL